MMICFVSHKGRKCRRLWNAQVITKRIPPVSILGRTICCCRQIGRSLSWSSTSSAHKEAAIFGHSSWQNSSSLVGLDGDWTAIFMSHHEFLIGSRFGPLSDINIPWPTPFQRDYVWGHCCWNMNFIFSLNLLAHRGGLFSSIASLWLHLCCLSVLTSLQYSLIKI